MRNVVEKEFFKRPVLEVAPDLLGTYLVRAIYGAEKAYKIVEVEAYDGEKDKACHASKGRTARTEVMYGPSGHWYVYLIYGMYNMLNIVTGREGEPSAILIRGVEGISGPGRLTRELGITRIFNNTPAEPASGLWIEDRGVRIERKAIRKLARVGVDYAEEWAEKPYRFLLDTSQ